MKNISTYGSKRIGSLKVVLFGLIFSIFGTIHPLISFANELDESFTSEFVRDSLIVKKTSRDKEYVFRMGDDIKIWTEEYRVKGQFIEMNESYIVINDGSQLLEVELLLIKKIKVFSKPVARLIGGAFKVWGSAIIVAGLAVPFAWGLGGLLLTVPATAAGFGIFKFGEIVFGTRRIKLNEKWILA